MFWICFDDTWWSSTTAMVCEYKFIAVCVLVGIAGELEGKVTTESQRQSEAKRRQEEEHSIRVRFEQVRASCIEFLPNDILAWIILGYMDTQVEQTTWCILAWTFKRKKIRLLYKFDSKWNQWVRKILQGKRKKNPLEKDIFSVRQYIIVWIFHVW